MQSARIVEYTDYISAEDKHFPNECPAFDIKQSDGEAPLMQEILGKSSNPSLPSFHGPLWPGVVVPDRVLSMC